MYKTALLVVFFLTLVGEDGGEPVGSDVGEGFIESPHGLADQVMDGIGGVQPIGLDVDGEVAEGDGDRDGAAASASGVGHRTASKVSR